LKVGQRNVVACDGEVKNTDLAISAHLMTEAEIDDFINDAIAELEEIRLDAKKALAAAASR
jgi:hypothetical protein